MVICISSSGLIITYWDLLAIVPPSPPRPPSSQGLGILTMALFFTGAGCVIAAIPAISSAADLITPPSDEETLLRFVPDNELARHIDSYIQTHPLTVSLRSQPRFTESRPHLRIPEAQRRNHFTGGVLIGPEKVTVPPIVWTEQGGKSQVTIAYLGADLCGHPGDIHGGLLATMLDEGLARCSFGALPNGVGMTANLKVDYRSPAAAESFIVLRARTTKVEGRKAWVEGSVETLATPGKAPVLLAEASGLFIEPRQAAVCQRLR